MCTSTRKNGTVPINLPHGARRLDIRERVPKPVFISPVRLGFTLFALAFCPSVWAEADGSIVERIYNWASQRKGLVSNAGFGTAVADSSHSVIGLPRHIPSEEQ